MSESPEAFLPAAWRAALILTGSRGGATRVFKESLDETMRHPRAGDHQGIRLLFFTILRRRALKFPAQCELEGFPAQLHRQVEPGRSALTLLLLGSLSASEIEHVLGVDERYLATTLEKTRAQLQEAVSSK